jgi:hypothetical protein
MTRSTVLSRTVFAMVGAIVVTFAVTAPAGASGPGAPVRHNPRACVHPVKLREGAHYGGPINRHFEITTLIENRPPFYNFIESASVASHRPGARITALYGRNSDGKYWVGHPLHVNQWRYDPTLHGQVHIKWFVVRGCFG